MIVAILYAAYAYLSVIQVSFCTTCGRHYTKLHVVNKLTSSALN